MKDMHPATWILWGLLMISIATNYVQLIQIRRLEKEIAPVIIRPHIKTYEKPDEINKYTGPLRPRDFYLVYKYWTDEDWRLADDIIRRNGGTWLYQQ